MNILIIEDEIRAGNELQKILSEIDDSIRFYTIIDSVEYAIEFLNKTKDIDLIFSDIQLVDGNSFSIYSKVDLKCPIIFCTAFDEYLLEALDTNAVSYILKPISKDKIEKALDKYNSFKNIFQATEMAEQLNSVVRQLALNYKTTLLVDYREKMIPISVKDIAYCYLENSVVRIVTKQNQNYFQGSTLEILEKQLNPEFFFRANRQFIINKEFVASVERYFSRKLLIKLIIPTSESIMVSKEKTKEFLNWLEL